MRRFITSYVRDQARAGVLPKPLQGSVRAITALPSAANARIRPIGVVLGVERLLWQAVEHAYPEWDLLFASNRTDPDGCVNEIIRLGATAIIGPTARRRHVVALRDSGINILRLSPAPLPRLTYRGRHAYGYVLEPSTSWMSARRLSEMEVVLTNGSALMTSAMKADAAFVAARIALPDPITPTTLVINTSDAPQHAEQDHSAIDYKAIEGGGSVETFQASRNNYWLDDSLDRFDLALSRASTVMTSNHPLAVAALLRGFRPRVSRRIFMSGLNVYTNPIERRISVEDRPLVSQEELVAVCVLWAARYICEGFLIDPVDFFTENHAT